MTELAKAVAEASREKSRGADPAEAIRAEAEREAEEELTAAIKSGDGRRIRAAMRAVRELDD